MPVGFCLSHDEAFVLGDKALTLDLTLRLRRDDLSFPRRPIPFTFL